MRQFPFGLPDTVFAVCLRPQAQGCQVLVTEKAKFCFKKGKILGFYYINFYRLKKGQLLNKF